MWATRERQIRASVIRQPTLGEVMFQVFRKGFSIKSGQKLSNDDKQMVNVSCEYPTCFINNSLDRLDRMDWDSPTDHL